MSRSVGVTGFEPAAFRSQSGCATKLRYTPVIAGAQRQTTGDNTA
jgi:hypothetical protein